MHAHSQPALAVAFPSSLQPRRRARQFDSYMCVCDKDMGLGAARWAANKKQGHEGPNGRRISKGRGGIGEGSRQRADCKGTNRYEYKAQWRGSSRMALRKGGPGGVSQVSGEVRESMGTAAGRSGCARQAQRQSTERQGQGSRLLALISGRQSKRAVSLGHSQSSCGAGRRRGLAV